MKALGDAMREMRGADGSLPDAEAAASEIFEFEDADEASEDAEGEPKAEAEQSGQPEPLTLDATDRERGLRSRAHK